MNSNSKRRTSAMVQGIGSSPFPASPLTVASLFVALVVLALGSSPAHADSATRSVAQEGERCGKVDWWWVHWEDECAPGLTCDIEDSGWWGERGRCVATAGCASDDDCDAAFACLPSDAGPSQCVSTDPDDGTERALDAFFAAHGGRSAFPNSYVTGVEAALRAEDDVAAGRFDQARARVDSVFQTFPLSDDRWWQGAGQDGTNVGSPVAYYALRMLDEIVETGLSEPAPADRSITFGVAIADCAEGFQPITPELEQPGIEVNLELDPAVQADDHEVIRQTLRLFQKYVWAITDGRLELELVFHYVDTCAEVYFEAPSHASISNWYRLVRDVPAEIQARTDFWWLIYPSNVPDDPSFDGKELITGGMGGYGDKPVFISDEKWLLRKPPHLGTGPQSEVERRAYFPQWLQHEFFHHLFRIYPEFELEEDSHQWFDRSTWPSDFVGKWEPDYYAEALNKRIRTSDRPLWQTLTNTSDDQDE